MEQKIKYSITTSDGKTHKVSKENIDKYGIAAYADAYQGATIRMRDDEGADYDMPLEHYEKAVSEGLRAFLTRVDTDYSQKAAAPPRPDAQSQQAAAAVWPETDNTAQQAAARPTAQTSTQPPEPRGWQPSPMQKRAFQMQMDAANARIQRQDERFRQRMEGIKKGYKPGAFMGEKGFNPQTGEMETRYYTTQGERVGTQLEQSRHNTEYQQWWENNTEEGKRSKEQRLQREFDDRLARLWQKPGRAGAAEAAWSAAEERQKAAAERNAKRSWNSYASMGGGREMRIVTASMNRHDDQAAHLTNFDLDRLMNDAWDNLGEDGQAALIDDCYQMLRYRNPGVDELVIYNQAKEFARGQSNKRLYDLAVEKNLPQDNLEYILRKIGDMNLLNNISKGAAEARAGTTGDMAAYEAANEQYRQDGHKILDVAGTVAGFALDPTTWLSAGVGGAAARGIMWMGGRFLAGRGASAAVTQAATRQLATSMTGRIVGGVAGGAVNFGTFEGVKEIENQFAHGGHIVGQDESGRYINEGYSASAVAGQVSHGMVMGGAIGWLGPVSGNVSDKLVRATSSTVGKVAGRAGVYTGATIAEGTIFSVPEWIEGDRDAFDVWTDNMAMMAGFKAKHIVKSAGGVLGDLKASFDSPTNGSKNRLDFESRLRIRMDAPSDGGMALTKDETAELERFGYNLRDLVESAECAGNPAEGGLIAQNAPEIVSRLTDMVTDPRVSEAVRAKMYYYATGRMLPMSTVMKGELIEDGDGGFIVESQGANGVITSRSFKSRIAADLELERIHRQTELNSIEIGERFQQTLGFENRLQEACRTVAAETNGDLVAIYRICEEARRNYKRSGDKQLDEAKQSILRKVTDAMGEFEETGVTDAIRGRINEKYGVDIDAAIRKGANRRTQAERTAIDEYIDELIPDKAKDRPIEDATAEDITNQKLLTDESDPAAEDFNGTEPIGPRFDNSSDPAPDYDPHQSGGEQKPFGRAVMKYQDRPVEVLSGRVVMMEDGTMIDNERSDASIVIRDVATGKIEMAPPEAILTYEDYAPVEPSIVKTPADDAATPEKPKYTSGQIKIRDSDGTETRGVLTGYVDEDGKHEYYVEGDLRHLHYATEDELDGILTEYLPDELPESADNSVSSQNETESVTQDGNRPEQDNSAATRAEGHDGSGVVGDESATAVSGAGDRGDIRVYEAWLGAAHREHSDDSERDRREAESERLVGIAKQQGQYIDKSAQKLLGVKQSGNSGESEVYVNKEQGRVFKVKDPYAKSPMKGHVQPEEAIYEHLVHNKYFPETAYNFEGISDDIGDVRIVLSQRYVDSYGKPTKEQIETALAEKGLLPEGKYAYGNDEVSITDVTGDNALLGNDGKVYFIDPVIDFKRPATEIIGDAHPEATATLAVTGDAVSTGGENIVEPAPLQRIPKDANGNPIFEQADNPETAWDALVEYSEGDATTAQEIADAMVEEKRKAFEKAQKLKIKGKTPAEMLASKKENAAVLAQAQSEHEYWQKMANVERNRQIAIRSQREAEARRLAAERAEAEKAEKAAREEAERIEREALEGIPEWHMDTPENARKRGVRRFSGQMFTRQEPLQGVAGKEVEVKFSQDDLPKGRVAVIEASQLQPSHVQGQRNPMFFIDEAQPKNRAEAVSMFAAKQIAEGIRPEEITGSVTAYTGAPTVNTRGEVIQGNNRSDALRYLWENNLPKQQQAYKQYILDNAERFGIDPEAVNVMRHPVLVNMLDVDDTESIRLGQMTAQDTESGGIERIKPKNVAQKLGDDMRSFANMLLRSGDDDASFGQLVDRNGTEVLKWMNQVGAISNTQYQSALDSKGNLKAEAKNDLQKVLYQAVFKGGSQQLEEMFEKIPVKAQRAILATAFRDMDSPFAGKMLPEIQSSIAAYNLLMADPNFADAKKLEKVLRVVEDFKNTFAFDDRFEQYMPADNFSNFALHLAAMYKATDMSQSTIASYFNQMYDLAQGKKAATLFDEADTTEYPLADIIRQVFNFEYQPAKNGNNNVADGGADVALRNQAGQGGQLRGNEPPASGEQTPSGAEPSDRGAGVAGDGRGSGTPQAGRGNSQEEIRRLTQEDAASIIADMEGNADVAPQMELTIENWDAQFGEDGIVNTPIGEVKMGENQFAKLMRQGRDGKLGMIKPTLENPYAIVEDGSEAKEGDTTERASSYVFIRAFKKSDDTRYYYFTSVSVSKDGKEVIISNQEKRRSVIKNLLLKGNLIWKHADDVSDASDVAQGLYSSQGKMSDLATEGTDAPQIKVVSSENSGLHPKTQNEATLPLGDSSELTKNDNQSTRLGINSPTVSERKDSASLPKEQISAEESSLQHAESEDASLQMAVEAASAEVNTAPTPAQAEAGNYKKGHVTIGEFDITIENPAGSTRKGVDANGKEWQTTMANAYGYIKGTEGVDGDHIDVFLHEDMDEWNGRKVFVVDQTNTDGSFDEHKVMLGFNDKDEAMTAYLANYDATWARTHPGLRISEVNIEDFNKWVQSSHRKTKPFAEYSTVSKTTDNAPTEPTTAISGNEYSVVSKPYTNKQGKTLDTYLVTFDRDFSKEEMSALLAKAKALKGWYDRETRGWMLRSQEDAKAFADGIAGKSEDEVADEAPLSMAGMDNAADTAVKKVDVGKVADALKTKGKTKLSNHAEPVETPKPKKKSKWISDEDAAEFDSLRDGLRNQFSAKAERQADNGKSGDMVQEESATYGTPQPKQMDAEVLRMGTHMTYLMMKGGLRSFADYCEAMKEELPDIFDDMRPHLKSLYAAAQNMEEVMRLGWDEEMDDRKTVKAFDVYNFDKPGAKDIIATAQHIVDEQASQQQTGQIIQSLKDQRNEQRRKGADKELRGIGNGRRKAVDIPGGNFADIPVKREENSVISQETTNSYEKETDLHSRPGAAERERGHEPRQDEPLGTRQRDEAERPLGGGMAGRGGVHTVPDTERGEGISGQHKSEPNVKQPKNTRNNHAERGVDYAPKGEKARIDANIAAIELAKELLASSATATPQEMEVLRRYSGWGGLGAAFNEGNSWSPNPINKRLRELLTQEEYDAAVMSRNSAYYTPAPVIDAMWDIAKALGFKGGNVLEGSAGIGNIIGLMPTELSERSNIHAVEIDGTTGGILSLLYPDAKVEVQGFEKTRIGNGTVDLAITNVPFVTGLHVMDESGDSDLSKRFRDIHDFCIAKNVRKLREGGIGIFITSSGTLDKSQKLRNWLVGDKEGCADVVGAFRMNNQTFGGTAATSDIIVVRKRVNGRKSANAIDVGTVTVARTAPFTDDKGKTKDLPLIINRYFIEHPECMGGEMFFNFEQGSTYRATSVGLFPTRTADQTARMAAWVQDLAEKDSSQDEAPGAMRRTEKVDQIINAAGNVNEALGEDVKEGSMVLDSEGNLCVARMGRAVPLSINKNKIKGRTKEECFRDYTEIKDALAEVLKYQTEYEGDAGLQPLLDRLNRAYDTFIARYGNLNKNNNLAWLRNDVDFSSIVALETYSEKGSKDGKKIKTYGKTDIFSRRVVDKETEPAPKNVKDGIIASIYKFGRIDPEYLSEQLGKGAAEIKQEIIDSGLGFENPTTGQMEVSYEYLSGNVREKLRQAREASESDSRFEPNIKALEAVLPLNIPAHLIEFSLGSSWVDPKLYERFVKERTGLDVALTSAGGTWHISEPWYTDTPKNKEMGIRSETLGIFIPGHKLIEAAITNKTITVSKTYREYDGTTRTETDPAATTACAAKVDEIRQDFKDWARERMQADPELSMRIEQIYNEQFNNSVPKTIPDEFVPEHFGGAATMVGGNPFKLRPHQAKAVIRATTQPLMLAHEVGTGKTYTLITTAMEMRRLGTARKPMIVVQNATVGQFVASAKALYPNAKVLTLEDAERNAEGRKAFYSKIKFNDWDMIVVPQSVFERIPDSMERQTQFIQDKIDEKLLVLEQMKDADPDGKSMIVRAAEREISNLENEISQLANGGSSDKKKEKDEKKAAITRQNAEVKAQELLDRATDDVEDFDSMGIDALLIDEAHEYKHLGFATAMQRGVKGIDPSPSKKSQGVYLKTQAVLEKTGGKNVVFATGTPISNTAAEIWTFMRYLMPADVMKDYDIFYFDDFVRNFGNLQQMLEFSTSGKYKENNRFAGYVNLPELVRIWSTVADTVLTREAGGVSDKIPAMEGGKAQDIFLPQTRALRGIMKYVKRQLDEYDRMSGKEKKENSHIPLVMYGIAKAAAVDARLVQSDAEDDPNSKTNEAVRQTLKTLEGTKDYRGTVAIFADNYQNKVSGFNLYEDIREKLIEAGVPEEQIVVMKSGMTVKKKLEIFDRVNAGEVRVVMGSTSTLGTGVNIQERLHTLIHLDAPNRPMDYTQRNGRILRQGNLHKEWGLPVRVLRFGVEDSLDVTAYQRLKTKGAIADSVMNGKQLMENSMENRTLEEDQDLFGDITAQLSGSEYALLKNQIEKEVRKLTAKLKAWEADQTYIHNRKRQIAGQNKEAEKRLSDNKTYLEKVEAAKIGNITVGKLSFPTVEAMEDFFTEQNKKKAELQEQVRKQGYSSRPATSDITISIGGFDFNIHTEIRHETKQGQQGDLFSSAPAKMTYSCAELGIEGMPVKGNLIKNAAREIMEDVISGKDFRERIETAERSINSNNAELRSMAARDGAPFQFADELAKAQEKLAEYDELMKEELAAREAKYAEMDKDVETAGNIELTEEDSEDVASEPGASYSTENRKFASRYETKDGKTVRYTSENPEAYAVYEAKDETSDSGTGASDIQRQGNTLLAGRDSGLNKETGEFSVVERVFTESGSFNFTSGEKIESADDVAFIFSALEDAAKEHSFVILVKNGQPTVVELGMGTFTATMVDVPTASLAYNRIRPDQVYFVHNHPSGNLKCSPQDVQMLRKISDMSDVPVFGVIINLKTGKYGTFDIDSNTGVGQKRIPGNQQSLAVHTLDKQIFTPDYDPMAQPLVRGAEDVAKFLNSHRMGDRAKVSFLILSRAGRIVGNIHTPFRGINSDIDEKARYISQRVIQFGGESAILYGDFEISNSHRADFKKMQERLQAVGSTTLLDVVRVEGNHTASANDMGLMWEPGSEYGASPEGKSAHAEKLSKKFNTPIKVINDINDIKGSNTERQARMRRSKGWYDPATGEVVVVIPNNLDVEDVAATVFHEVVAHKGLRELVGDEHYDAFCREVYEHAAREVREKIADKAKRHGWDFGEATDEYLGELSEKGFEDFTEAERGIWAKLKAKALEAINKFLGSLKLPKWVKLGDNELRYMLWRSHEKLRTKGDYVDMARDVAKREELGLNGHILRESREEAELRRVNNRFNDQLTKWENGEMDKNDMFHLGNPHGVMRAFLPNIPIVMRQRIMTKGSVKRHNVAVSSLVDMPEHLSRPIFVFKRSEDALGVLTEMKDRNGKNVCVAIELNREIQNGGEVLEVNDIRSVHGRNIEDIAYPIVQNGTLKWVDKEKGLAYLSSASRYVQQEIDKQNLDDAAKVVKNFENPTDDGEIMGLRSGGVSLRDIDFTTEQNRTLKSKEEYARIIADEQKKMRHRVEAAVIFNADDFREYLTKLGESPADIETDVREYESAVSGKHPIVGGYDPNTKKIVIFANKSYTSEGLRLTIAHEQLHYAIDIDPKAKAAMEELSPYIYERHPRFAAKIAKSYSSRPKEERDEEVVIYFIEGAIQEGTLQLVYDRLPQKYQLPFITLTETLGYGTRPTDTETGFYETNDRTLNRTARNTGMDDGGATERNYGLDALRPDGSRGDIKRTETRGSGAYESTPARGDEPPGGGLRFRQTIAPPGPGVARDYYERKVRRPNESGTVKKHHNLAWRAYEGYLDSMAALKALMDGIVKETGNEIPSYADAYKAENAMTSANKGQTEAFERDYTKPMFRAATALMQDGAAYDDITRYLIAKHGLERNEVLARRDYDAYISDPQNDPSAKSLDDFRGRDYSGLTSLFNSRDVAEAERDARGYVKDFETEHGGLVDDMWNAINAATKATLKIQYDAWMMSKDTYDKVNGMFKYYIPLRGWDSNVAADEYNYNDSSRQLRGAPVLKTAKGRTSVADDPIATIAYMGERGIAAANRNKMKQKFLNFVLENPTSLATVHQQWYVKGADGNWTPADPIIPSDADGDTIHALVAAHEAKMKALEATGGSTRKRTGLKLGLNTALWQQDEHKVRVKHGDKEFVIYINGNPAAAHALNGLTNPDSRSGPVERKLTEAKGAVSALLTSLNPAFIAANLIMDSHMGMVAAAIKENAGYNIAAAKNAARMFGTAALPRLLHKWEKGTLSATDPIEKYFNEFMLNGGETGFTQLHTINDYKKRIAKFQRQATEGIGKKGLRLPREAWRTYWDTIERLNRAAEDTTRFIVYMTSRQQGRDIARSIADAKEITVNFNRKGSGRLGQRQMNFCYYFFNAAMQSVANFGRLLKNNPKKTVGMLLSHVAMGFLVPMLNQLLLSLWGDDEDKDAYWELPEWQRRNNIVMYVPFTKGMFLTIPLAHELRPFYGVGEAACGVSQGHDELGDGIASAAAGFTSMMPIDYTGNGGDPLINFTPSIAQPVAQVIGNVDYFGKPVYRDSPYKALDPEHTKAYRGTSPIFVEASQLVNAIGGGDDVKKGPLDSKWTNPDVMEHLFNGYTGGAGKTLVQFGKGLQMLWDEDMREVRNAPVVSRFVTRHDQRSRDMNLNNAYYELIEEYEQTAHALSGYRNKARLDSVAYARKLAELMESDEYARYKKARGYKKAIDYLRSRLKGVDPDSAVKVERKILELKKEMIDSVRGVRSQGVPPNR